MNFIPNLPISISRHRCYSKKTRRQLQFRQVTTSTPIWSPLAGLRRGCRLSSASTPVHTSSPVDSEMPTTTSLILTCSHCLARSSHYYSLRGIQSKKCCFCVLLEWRDSVRTGLGRFRRDHRRWGLGGWGFARGKEWQAASRCGRRVLCRPHCWWCLGRLKMEEGEQEGKEIAFKNMASPSCD